MPVACSSDAADGWEAAAQPCFLPRSSKARQCPVSTQHMLSSATSCVRPRSRSHLNTLIALLRAMCASWPHVARHGLPQPPSRILVCAYAVRTLLSASRRLGVMVRPLAPVFTSATTRYLSSRSSCRPREHSLQLFLLVSSKFSPLFVMRLFSMLQCALFPFACSGRAPSITTTLRLSAASEKVRLVF